MRTDIMRESAGNRSKAIIFCIALCAALLSLRAGVQSQQLTKVQTIGYLSAPPLSVSGARIKAFLQGLHELGYVEGKNIVIEWRSAEGRSDRLSALATELVRLKVDVIVTGGGAATRAAKDANGTIPIITAQDPDPVGRAWRKSQGR